MFDDGFGFRRGRGRHGGHIHRGHSDGLGHGKDSVDFSVHTLADGLGGESSAEIDEGVLKRAFRKVKEWFLG